MMLRHLPHEIITDIFSRLPSECKVQCIQVCKTWRNILHPIRRESKINLLFVGKYGLQRTQFYHGEYDDKSNKKLDEQLCHNALKPLGCPRLHYPNLLIVGFNRGLVCFGMNYEKLGRKLLSYNDPIYVCNPFTQETVRVPQLTIIESEAKTDFLFVGFGYLNTTKEYKIVRIFYYEDNKFCKGQVQVYTLGDKNGWRYKGITDHFMRRSDGVLCNGALHWIANMGKDIVAFDLADEKFHSLPVHPCFPELSCCLGSQLVLLRGCLSIVLHTFSCTDIWSLKPLMDTNKERGDTVELHWSNELTVESEEYYQSYYYFPIALTEENKVLFWHTERHLLRLTPFYHHDPKTATSEEFVYDDGESFEVFQVIPYMKSNVSLTVLVPDLPVVNWDSMS